MFHLTTSTAKAADRGDGLKIPCTAIIASNLHGRRVTQYGSTIYGSMNPLAWMFLHASDELILL